MEQTKPQVFIRTHFDLCTGCALCKTACSMHVFGGYNPNKGMLIIRHLWENLAHIPVVCQQCRNAMCMKVCPVKAIYRDEQTQAVVIDQKKCISCRLCSQYCPLGVIHRDLETQKAYKCDLCQGNPQCVQVCPFGALELGQENRQSGE
ncbi:4Fe-4S dicluster domain-containing protein [Desulfonatronovibrio magnus]|uniref:4Fe-4S dicluster domain-containing protein n=1 Tax=Desulfonatronovibrio magnus TaxID=698827 RepID=UPI0005EBCB0B|nr:4Fe-4S dicluster domain-containing protein [Desulfonatronovibrio magnus]